MDGMQLLTNLGGTTGLWAGTSIVTFMEFVELFFSAFFKRLMPKNAVGQVVPSPRLKPHSKRACQLLRRGRRLHSL